MFLHVFRHRSRPADRAEILSAPEEAQMADVTQTQKMIPFSTCEIALCQCVCELVSGIDVFDLRSLDAD